MELFLQPDTWIALLTLTFLEIVLGVDNIIFISIVSGKLPENEQAKTRNIGLLLALVFRIGLLFVITWIIGFDKPLFTIDWFKLNHAVSGRDLILLAGGLFLLAKSTTEIHHKVEGEEHSTATEGKSSILAVIGQIVVLDMVFSFDSILTAIGLTKEISIMIIAVIISIIVMMIFAGKISSFINKHPSLQILALSFLILIGVMLMVEALHVHVPKGYIYFAVFFSLVVEIVNMRVRKSKKTKPVELKKHYRE